MKVSIDIQAKDIADFMASVIEGNHMVRAWCGGIYLISPSETLLTMKNDSPWYSIPGLYSSRFEIEIHEILDESKEAKGKNLKKHLVSSTDFAEGFRLMLEKSPRHFADFISGNYDSITADVFIQYVALKEVVYG